MNQQTVFIKYTTENNMGKFLSMKDIMRRREQRKNYYYNNLHKIRIWRDNGKVNNLKFKEWFSKLSLLEKQKYFREKYGNQKA